MSGVMKCMRPKLVTALKWEIYVAFIMVADSRKAVGRPVQ